MKPENLLRPTAMTKPERASRWRPDLLIPLALAMILGATPPVHAGQNSSSQPGPFAGIGISAPALSLINDLVSADRTNFFVYQDSDSGFNHGFPSGFFPGGPVLSKIHLDTACVYDPASANGCTTDTTRLDRVRGTVMRVTFDPLVPGEFVGINIEEPENFGANPRGVGYDLRGATRVCIDAASPIPPAAGFKVQFCQ